ncbi:MAG TPA: helicase [Firmicutes bacterium]|nr:helicase [Bacillota bacterium]
MAQGFADIRDHIVEAVIAEMMGPGSELPVPPCAEDAKFEIISENPLQRYSVGILYEQKVPRDIDDESTEERDVDGRAEVDELLDVATTTANQYYPSSIGMSFYATGQNPAIIVDITAGQYRRLEWDECVARVTALSEGILNAPFFHEHLVLEDGILKLKQKMTKDAKETLKKLDPKSEEWAQAIDRLYSLQFDGWKRTPLGNGGISVAIPHVSSDKPTKEPYDVCEGLECVCVRRPKHGSQATLFTIALINDFEGGDRKKAERSFFQVGFSVRPAEQGVRFLDYERLSGVNERDSEQVSMALLYRNRKVFAVGHGCAVSWNEQGTLLRTEIIPSYEVPSLDFDAEELSPVAEILSMRNLSDISSLGKAEIIEGLERFVAIYKDWIDRKHGTIHMLDENFRSTAEKHLADCYECADRLMRGVRSLENPVVFKAFQLANRAMLMQRAHTRLQEKKRYPDETNGIIWPDYDEFPLEEASWRPFQLAFFLLNLESIIDPTSRERHIVDLIWFPTGGGKTEAYLGISAFTIFLRRLRHRDKGKGTAIIMRYTLRLLTAQQFQRASTLICACEFIRRENPDLFGESSISIGLWIGSSSTPNSLSEAEAALDRLTSGAVRENPFQVLSCPWCGTRLTKDRGIGRWGYELKTRPRRFVIRCTEETCVFKEELPIKVVDEDIYKDPPTLLFATVDKFAMLPWKRETKNIFGLASDSVSPELIIQDELHLISGPLGTIVGLYETAVDLLCSTQEIPPKIIASTATIRRAGDQVKALYNRKVYVFPPAAMEAEDSFFAREIDTIRKPGRMYVGIMATGRTLTTTQIRLMAGLVQHTYEMDFPPEIKDLYWTLVCYFNTIRELGRTSTLALDDIKDQVRRVALRRGTERRIYYQAHELTGSRKSEDIPAMLEKMAISYPNKDAIDILLASSMISVGIDIDRLGLMTVVSQPKSTSEYIQATSRVGRKHPGLVFTLYDGARPRDRSHYERFIAYHRAFYRYVEPTSVTPFSGPARDRALHAVLVSLARHCLDGLSRDNKAGNFSAEHQELHRINEAIIERARSVMPEEAESTASQLDSLIEEWSQIAKSYEAVWYSRRTPRILYPAYKAKDGLWPTMQSMRNVDVPSNIKVLEEDWGI